MITLNRDYFVQKANETQVYHRRLENFISEARKMKLAPSVIDSIEEEEMKAWSSYRLAVVSLERFDLGKMVYVDGIGYVNSYLKS